MLLLVDVAVCAALVDEPRALDEYPVGHDCCACKCWDTSWVEDGG